MGKVKGEAGAQAGMIWVALLPESDTETDTDTDEHSSLKTQT